MHPRYLFVAAIGALAFSNGASASSISGWIATGSSHAGAGDDYGNTVTCDSTESYVGMSPVTDELTCSAYSDLAGGRSTLRLTLSATPTEVSTQVGAEGGGGNYLSHWGYWYGDFGQTTQIVVDEPAVFHLVGAVSASDLSRSAVGLGSSGGVLVEHVAIGGGEGVSFDDTVPLDVGVYWLGVDLHCAGHIIGPGGQNWGRAGVVLQGSLSSAAGVEAQGWGRVKSRYR